jgi:hypothetical protein
MEGVKRSLISLLSCYYLKYYNNHTYFYYNFDLHSQIRMYILCIYIQFNMNKGSFCPLGRYRGYGGGETVPIIIIILLLLKLLQSSDLFLLYFDLHSQIRMRILMYLFIFNLIWIKVPSVHWEDIGGMEGVKRSLREVIEMPQKFPHLFESLGIYWWENVYVLCVYVGIYGFEYEYLCMYGCMCISICIYVSLSNF